MRIYHRIRSIMGVVMLLVLLIWSSSAFALDDEKSRATLKDINELGVVLEILEPPSQRITKMDRLTREVESETYYELEKAEIQKDVEFKLRVAGIKVLSDKVFRASDKPYLLLKTDILEYYRGPAIGGSLTYKYYLELSIVQFVLSKRNTNNQFYATTWSRSKIGSVPGKKDIRWAIKDLVDEFLNAYLSVNPR